MASDAKKEPASHSKNGNGNTSAAPAQNGQNGNDAYNELEAYKRAARDLLGDDGAKAIDDRVEELRSEKSGRRKRRKKAGSK